MDAQWDTTPTSASRSLRPEVTELARSLKAVKRIAPQPLRWYPLGSQSGTLCGCNRHDNPTRLADFNKHAKPPITGQADFAGFKESQVLQWSRAANIIDKPTLQLLENGLNRRNQAAHPSNASPSASNVESLIDDLVRHVILKYPLR